MENPFQNLTEQLLFIKQHLSILLEDVKELKESKPIATNVDRYIDKKEAASIAGVSLSTIDNWRRCRKIIPYYFDSVVRFYYKEFMVFLANQRME